MVDQVLHQALKAADKLLAKKIANKALGEVRGDVVLQYLFDKQRAVADDPHQFITACCGRRGGKTTGVCACMLRAAKDHPRRSVLYVTLTSKMAEANIWPTLKELNLMFGLGGVPRESDLTMTMPNGAVISLVGVDKRKEIEKRRGQGFALVVIDECQSIPEYIRSLVDDVIAPALVDVPGRLMMIGTPSLLRSGYWFECHHNKSDVWGHHAWTLFENPTLPNPQASLAAELARRGVSVDDVTIQREWFGKWVRDLISAVFKFDPVKNTHRGLPRELVKELWSYIIAVDLGGGVERDNDAITVLAYHPHHVATWLIEEDVFPKADVTEVALRTKAIYDRLGPRRVSNIVVDTGGIGAKVSLEMASRHKLPTVAAKKQDKWTNIELLNAACRRGEFFAPVGSRFATESVKVEKDWTKSTPDKIVIKGHMPDVCDSTLYGYVESLSWISKPVDDEPPVGSEEWGKKQERLMRDRAAADVRATKENRSVEQWGGEMDDWGGGIEWGG
jgi:hypothetical protein